MAAHKKLLGLFICLSLVLTISSLVHSDVNLEGMKPDYTGKEINHGIGLSTDTDSEVLDQKQDEMCGISYGVYPPWEFAQSFKPTLTTLTRVSLCLGKGEATPDNIEITVSIKKNLVETDLTHVTRSSTILAATKPEWIDFDFPDITITPENTYYIIIKTSTGSDKGTISWHYQYSDPYPRGSAWGSQDNGFEWFILEKYFWDFVDFTFRSYGLNFSPGIPTIQGTGEGKPRTPYPYIFSAIDPEGYNISYFIDWGDGTNSEWLGPYPSGTEITANHTWNKKKTYTVMAKARDMHGYESDWATLDVSMHKKTEIPMNALFLQFIEIIQARSLGVILVLR